MALRPAQLRKFVAPEFVFGQGGIHLAGQFAANLRFGRALVVTDPGVAEAGWLDPVLDSLSREGVRTTVFDDVSPNPRDGQVRAGAVLYKSAGCDSIVAVGGGSPMDCAKGIGLVSTNGGDVLDYEGVDMVQVPAPPLICIPSTAGTSADVSQFAIINDTSRKIKIAIVSKTMVPDVALIDPVVTSTMPAELTAATGLDALTHAVEAYVSTANGPVTDLFALNAIRLVAENLVPLLGSPGDLALREQMMLASLEAGLAFSNAILGAVHAMAHGLGGLLDLPHGECNAILLPHVCRANFTACPDRYREVARALGADVEDKRDEAVCDALVDRLEQLKREAGVTRGLGELGMGREFIAPLAQTALADPCMITNPKRLTAQEVEGIYEEAF